MSIAKQGHASAKTRSIETLTVVANTLEDVSYTQLTLSKNREGGNAKGAMRVIKKIYANKERERSGYI